MTDNISKNRFSTLKGAAKLSFSLAATGILIAMASNASDAVATSLACVAALCTTITAVQFGYDLAKSHMRAESRSRGLESANDGAFEPRP